MAQVISSRSKAATLLRLAIVLGWSSLFVCPAAEVPLEYQVKAVFLLNFTKFIEWPAAVFELPESPVSICILGEDPFGATINQIVKGEVVNGRKVVVQRISHAPAPKSCQVLFWGRTEGAATRPLPDMGPGVLTVGEGETFARQGGMIAFVIDNRRVRFDVNQAAAERAGLKISSKLLSVARDVQSKAGRE
jgi:hypothetical protein